MKSEKLIKMTNKIKLPFAFILGKYATTGLGVARCFGEQKVPVFWFDSNPKQPGFLSKYCKGFICPNPKNNEKEYIDFLLDFGKNIKEKGVLFPIADIEVSAVLKNRTKLEQYYHIPMANLDVTEKLLNKQKFNHELEKYKITHPKTFSFNDISDFKEISKQINYPCIIKPVNSVLFREEFNTKFFRVENNRQMLDKYTRATSKNQEVIVQEIIPGDAKYMYGFDTYYDKKFTSHGNFVFRRIREWPTYSGNGVFIENAQYPELEKITTSLINKIKYYGIVDAEFKLDPRNNKLNLIEINPRCWMQISLPYRCGINLPYIAYMDAIGKKIDAIYPLKNNFKWLFFYQDLPASVRDIKNHELTIKDWIFSYTGKKEYAIFSWRDPLPFFRFISKIRRTY